jgi:hypothetical protein
MDRAQIRAPGEDMKAVEDEANGRVIGAADDLPGVAVVVNMPPPGERLIADADAAFSGELAQFMKIGSGAIQSGKRVGRNIAADEQLAAAELLHDIEFALCARECACALRLRHSLEITERLKSKNVQAETIHHAGHIARGAVKRQQIGLENFNRVETGGSDRFQLLGKAATQ